MILATLDADVIGQGATSLDRPGPGRVREGRIAGRRASQAGITQLQLKVTIPGVEADLRLNGVADGVYLVVVHVRIVVNRQRPRVVTRVEGVPRHGRIIVVILFVLILRQITRAGKRTGYEHLVLQRPPITQRARGKSVQVDQILPARGNVRLLEDETFIRVPQRVAVLITLAQGAAATIGRDRAGGAHSRTVIRTAVPVLYVSGQRGGLQALPGHVDPHVAVIRDDVDQVVIIVVGVVQGQRIDARSYGGGVVRSVVLLQVIFPKGLACVPHTVVVRIQLRVGAMAVTRPKGGIAVPVADADDKGLLAGAATSHVGLIGAVVATIRHAVAVVVSHVGKKLSNLWIDPTRLHIQVSLVDEDVGEPVPGALSP